MTPATSSVGALTRTTMSMASCCGTGILLSLTFQAQRPLTPGCLQMTARYWGTSVIVPVKFTRIYTWTDIFNGLISPVSRSPAADGSMSATT